MVITDDLGKETLLEAVVAILPAETKLLIGGFSHFTFHDEIFDRVRRELFIPSFANGYQYSLVHIYQCLQNAHRQGLKGVVAEFGMFKGGTTMLISRFIEELGADWKVFGFDTFNGFPPDEASWTCTHTPIASFWTWISSRRYSRDAMWKSSKATWFRRFRGSRIRTSYYLSWIPTIFRPQTPLFVS